MKMKSTTLISLTAAGALLASIAVVGAQNGSIDTQDTSSPSVKSHADRAHVHFKRTTTGNAVGDPGTTQRDKDVNTWATEK